MTRELDDVLADETASIGEISDAMRRTTKQLKRVQNQLAYLFASVYGVSPYSLGLTKRPRYGRHAPKSYPNHRPHRRKG